MKLVNNCAEKVFKNPKEWAIALKKDLEREYKIYKREAKKPLAYNMSKFLEGVYISDYIEWFLENYFD